MPAKTMSNDSLEKLRRAIETVLVPYHSLDVNGAILNVNREWLKALGYDRQDVVGKPFKSFLTETSRELFPERFSAFKTKGEVQDVEFDLIRSDGTVINVRFSGRIEFDDAKRFVCTHCTFRDISAEKAAAEELRASEVRYRSLFDQSPDGILVHRKLIVLFANAAAARILGFEGPDKLVGARMEDLVHPDSFDRVARRSRRVMRSKQALEPEGQTYRRRDGTPVPVEATGQAIKVDGKWAVQSILRDVSRRQQYESALRERESRLSSILAVAPIGIGVVKDGVLQQVNVRFCEMVDRQPENLLGKSLGFLYPDETEFDRVTDEQTGQMADTGFSTVETRYLTRDGRALDVLVNSTPLDPGNLPAGVTFTALDISNWKTSERELREERDFTNAVFEMASSLVVVLDSAGRIIRFNRTCERITGYRREEVIGRPVWEIVIPEKDRATVRAVFGSGGTSDPIRTFENEWQAKNGERRLIRWSNSWFPNADGETYGIGIGLDITESKKVEIALVESEKRFRGLFENMQEGMILHEMVTDEYGKAIDYRIIDGNPAVQLHTGIDVQSAIGRRATELYGVDDPPLLDTYEKVANTGQPITFETDFEPTGRHFRVSAFSPRRGVFATVFNDITSRSRAEAEVKRHRERLAEVLEAAGEGIYAIDSEGLCVFCNSAALAFLGYETADQVVGKNMHELMHCRREDGSPYPKEECPAHLVAKTGQPAKVIEDWFIRSDGTTFPVEFSAHPMRVGEETVGAVICFADIADRKRTQERMHRLSTAVEQSPISIAITDADGRFAYINPCFVRESGYRLLDLETEDPPLLFSTGLDSSVQVGLSDALIRGIEWRGEVQMRTKAGDAIWGSLVMSPITDPQGMIVSHLWTFENVSERRKLERTLLQAQKMESLGQLTGGVAHDFNNILAVILTNAEILAEEYERDAHNAPVINSIVRAVYRGSSLTERLLAFSRRSELSPEPVDVSAMMVDMKDMLQRTLGETIDVKVEADSGLPSIVLDQHQFENAILNLSVNARDAMPSGGSLGVRVTSEIPGPAFQTEDSKDDQGYVCVSVADTGCGIPAALLERIYEPLFTTKKKGEGTGFGLSMVYGFVKQSGGEIAVESVEGTGTVFRLFFPVASDKGSSRDSGPARDRKTAAAQDRGQVSPLNILLVEDDEHVRESTRLMLRGDGHNVVAASDGDEAVEILKDRPELNLVVSDVVMPGNISGRSLAAAVRGIRPDINLLFTSGYSAGYLSEADLLIYNAKFLPKPYSKKELDDAIAALVDGQPNE